VICVIVLYCDNGIREKSVWIALRQLMIPSAISLVAPQLGVYTCISLISCPSERRRGAEHMKVTVLDVRIVCGNLTPSIT